MDYIIITIASVAIILSLIAIFLCSYFLFSQGQLKAAIEGIVTAHNKVSKNQTTLKTYAEGNNHEIQILHKKDEVTRKRDRVMVEFLAGVAIIINKLAAKAKIKDRIEVNPSTTTPARKVPVEKKAAKNKPGKRK